MFRCSAHIQSLVRELNKPPFHTPTGKAFLRRLLNSANLRLTANEVRVYAPISRFIAQPRDFKLALSLIFKDVQNFCKATDRFHSTHLDLSEPNFFRQKSLACITDLGQALLRSSIDSIHLNSSVVLLTPDKLEILFAAITMSSITKLKICGDISTTNINFLNAWSRFIKSRNHLVELNIKEVRSVPSVVLLKDIKENYVITNVTCNAPSCELQSYLARNRKLTQIKKSCTMLCAINLEQTQSPVKIQSLCKIGLDTQIHIDSLVKTRLLAEDIIRQLINIKNALIIRMGYLHRNIGADDEAIATWLQVGRTSKYLQHGRMEAFLLQYALESNNDRRFAFISAVKHCFDNGKFISFDFDNQRVLDRLLLNAAGIRKPPIAETNIIFLTPNERIALLQFALMKHIQNKTNNNARMPRTLFADANSTHTNAIRKYLNCTLPVVEEIPTEDIQQELNDVWKIVASHAHLLNKNERDLINAISPVFSHKKLTQTPSK